MSPKNWAEVISICPLASANRFTFTEIRDTVSICLFCWSSICESSIMMRLTNPRSTRPMLTFVPNFADNASPTHSPIVFCMKGMCKSVTMVRYRPVMVHIIILIVRLNTCETYSLS